MFLTKRAVALLLPVAFFFSCDYQNSGDDQLTQGDGTTGTAELPMSLEDPADKVTADKISDAQIGINATTVSLEEAKATADTMAKRQSVTEGREMTICNVAPIEYKGEVVQYVAEFCDQGYMILSAAKDEPPLLMMNLAGNYLEQKESFWLLKREKKISYYSMAQKGYFEIKDLDLKEYNFYTYRGDFKKDIDTHRDAWGKFLHGDQVITPYNGTAGNPTFRNGMIKYGPLTTSVWAQSGDTDLPIFNYYVPSPAGHDCSSHYTGKCPAGCGPVALGQLMYYWQWPETKGGYNYNYGRMYDSKNEVKTGNLNGIHEVPKLLAQIGGYMGVQYWPDGSFPIDVAEARITMEDFGYIARDTDIIRTDVDDNMRDGWRDRAIVDISRNSPLILAFFDFESTGDHFVVADGYDSTNGGPLVHMNLGWGPGTGNEYLDVWVLFRDANLHNDLNYAFAYYMVEDIRPKLGYYATKLQGMIYCDDDSVAVASDSHCTGINVNYNSLLNPEGGRDNATRSLKVFSGWRTMFCADQDYGGRCNTLVAEEGTSVTMSYAQLMAKGFDDDISSFQVDKPGVFFCIGANRSSWCTQTQDDIADLNSWRTPTDTYSTYQSPSEVNYDNSISWMKLSRGWKVTLYSNANYSSSSPYTTTTFSDPQLFTLIGDVKVPVIGDDGYEITQSMLINSGNLNNQISSIKVQEPVTFCTDDNPPSGDCFSTQDNWPDLRKLLKWGTTYTTSNYDNSISWIKIPKGLKATLCDNYNYLVGGSGCRVFNASSSDIILGEEVLNSSANGYINNKISSIKIEPALIILFP